MNVENVKPSVVLVLVESMKELTLQRNLMYVNSVVKPACITVPYKRTRGLTAEKP